MVQCRNCEKTFKTEEDFQKHNLSCSADKNTHKKITFSIKIYKICYITTNKINEQQKQIDYIPIYRTTKTNRFYAQHLLEKQKQIILCNFILEQQKTIESLNLIMERKINVNYFKSKNI